MNDCAKSDHDVNIDNKIQYEAMKYSIHYSVMFLVVDS